MTAAQPPRPPAWWAAIGAGLALVGCADADVPAFADADALARALPDTSLVGTRADGAAVCLYHAESGRFIGRDPALVSGSWTIEDNAICYAFEQGGDRRSCARAVISGDRIAIFAEGALAAEGRLNEGNICS
ncbi:MAG: hypothetical protein R3F55_18155 [Alphaproteobacteria bacterium]